MSLMYIPVVSADARYLPSGEIAPLVTRLSMELVVSCRSFRSGTAEAGVGRLASQKIALATNNTAAAIAIFLQRVPRSVGSRSRFKLSKSARISDVDW